jgi:hypothetical protein
MSRSALLSAAPPEKRTGMANRVHPHEPPANANAGRGFGLSPHAWKILKDFGNWFLVPANLVSVAAIVAIIIVPWIERIAKSDETLQAKIDALLTATNSIVDSNKERGSLKPGDPASTSQYSIATAKRQAELARANAIANSILHDAYPVMLIVLSEGLCTSGMFEDGHRYSDEIIKRATWYRFFADKPALNELSQAHIGSAYCYAYQFQSETDLRARTKEQQLVNDEMESAITTLRKDAAREQGQMAVAYSEWAELDEHLADAAGNKKHKEEAAKIFATIASPDADLLAFMKRDADLVEADPMAPAKIDYTIDSKTAPRIEGYVTFLVTYPDSAEEAAAYVGPKPGLDLHSWNGVLYRFRRRVLIEADQVASADESHNGLYSIIFEKAIPDESTARGKPRATLMWTVSRRTESEIRGVESEVGKAVRPFAARLSNP